MSVQLFRRVAALTAVLLSMALLLGPATAQFGPTGPMRIGFILPLAPAGSTVAWQQELAQQVTHGALSGKEEEVFNADLLGLDFDVIFETATGPDEAVAAADRLLAQGVYGIAGGYTIDEALALGQWAQDHGIPYLNTGVQSDLLRNDMCFSTTFHLAASAAMYLDSLAGWYVRDGHRRWYVVRSDDAEGQRLADRLHWALTERHFGAREVGNVVLTSDVDTASIISGFDRADADVLVLLVDPAQQLRIYGELEDAGFTGSVAGYPYPETQTREYFAALRSVAPDIDLYRAVLWEPTIDTSGALEFNLRYRERWEQETMDGPAWAAFNAIKIFYDSATFSGSTDPATIIDYMQSPNSVFDLHKLLGASFRPWDHQLRQPLYLVNIDPTIDSMFQMGLLVGELPSLYLPGTDPVERLDQIGDLADHSTCSF